MEFSPRFIFCINLKKISTKAAKTEKMEAKAAMSRHEKNNVETSYDECHASYCNVATSVEIVRLEFCNVVTSPRHRLRHHSRLQTSNLQCHDITI